MPKEGTCNWGLVKFLFWKGGREEGAYSWAHTIELLSSFWEGGNNKSM